MMPYYAEMRYAIMMLVFASAICFGCRYAFDYFRRHYAYIFAALRHDACRFYAITPLTLFRLIMLRFRYA